MPFRLGPTELIIILVIVILVFGVGKLPEIGRNVGKAIREFRKHQAKADELKESLDLTKEPSKDKRQG